MRWIDVGAGRPRAGIRCSACRPATRHDHLEGIIVYVTITRVSGQRVTMRAAATENPPEDTRDVPSAPLCPPEQVDRTTGALRATNLVVSVSRSFAAAVAATRPATGLAGPVAGVLTHPGIGRLIAVGPFDSATALDH